MLANLPGDNHLTQAPPSKRRRHRPVDEEVEVELSMASVDPILRLAAAVVRTAALDVTNGNRRAAEAAEWLASQDSLPFLEVVGIDQDKVLDWLNDHFKSNTLQ